jgi:hypothetical protein
MHKIGIILLFLTGITAAIALCFPTLAVLGFLVLIVPGVVLLTSPTLFVYLAATISVERLLRAKTGAASFPIAIVAVIGLGWVIMQPSHHSEQTRFDTAVIPDVLAVDPIRFSGDVRIEHDAPRKSTECDYLCAAILDLPGVDSVTVVSRRGEKSKDTEAVVAYTLVDAGDEAEPGVFPSNPGRLIREHPEFVRQHFGDKLTNAERSLEADWAMRLTSDERICLVEPTPADRADWTVRLISTRNQNEPGIQRVEIVDGSDTVRFRKSHVRHFVPSRFFYIGYDLRAGAAMSSNATFRIGGWEQHTPGHPIQLEPTLLEAIEMPRLASLDDTRARLRFQVQRAMDDPNASPARLELARRWLSIFFFDATQEDVPVIARVIGDERVKDIAVPLANVFRKGQVPAALKMVMARRITFDHASQSERLNLARLLASMPDRTFANPAPEHLAIWTRPELLEQSGPFLSRVADLGAERAIPILDNALQHAITKKHWNERREMIAGIRDAYATLGKEANTESTKISQLILQQPSPITSCFKDVTAWRVTLARMGVPLDDLPFFPNSTTQQVAKIKIQIRDRLQRIQK